MSLPPLFSESFPSFIRNNIKNRLSVFWYHPEFSQSRYPPGQTKSEACTLICLLLAQRICKAKLHIESLDRCPELNILMAGAMIEGNNTHASILAKGLISHPYLNTVEALQFGGASLSTLKEWKFRVIYEKIELGLKNNIKYFLQEWYLCPKSENLFMLLITGGRTVLFIFQELFRKIILFDSHSHNTPENKFGLIVAQTSLDDLDVICDWYIDAIMHNCYKTYADQYELAFLYGRTRTTKCGGFCNCRKC